MDARVGAVTDAYDKGAREVDPMDLGTHTQLATNSRYSRNRLAATSRVECYDLAARTNPEKGARNSVRNKLRREGSRQYAKQIEIIVVRTAGVEPAQPCGRGILSPLRLPVSPRPHGARFFHILPRK